MIKRDVLTIEQVREWLDYDPVTGIFTWLKRPHRSRWPIEKRAGSLSANGYRYIQLLRVRYFEHRLAWFYTYGFWPTEIDHINRKPNDNRIANLREARHQDNLVNTNSGTRPGKHARGVWFDSKNKSRPYAARICHSGRDLFVGTFATPEEAHAAASELRRKLSGAYANV